jgi:hypothetical protein
MRTPKPLILVAVAALFALTAAGCGSSDNDNTKTLNQRPIPAVGFTPPSDAGDSGNSGDAEPKRTSSKPAQGTLDSCLNAAKTLPSAESRANARKGCKASYENIKEASKQVEQATSEARKMCEEAARKIDNAEAKAQTLEACRNFD